MGQVHSIIIPIRQRQLCRVGGASSTAPKIGAKNVGRGPMEWAWININRNFIVKIFVAAGVVGQQQQKRLPKFYTGKKLSAQYKYYGIYMFVI